MNEYKAEQLFRTAVPQWQQTTNGVWVRDWEIRLTAAIDEQRLDQVNHLSEDGIDAVATLSENGHMLRIRTSTRLNPFADDVFYGAAYRMLRKIDAEIQRIELIQGQPREAWQPFRQYASKT